MTNEDIKQDEQIQNIKGILDKKVPWTIEEKGLFSRND